ncbi:MAG: SDR family NAD(P)-dependent oxidoreductase [Ruminococcus sp.]|nr:SDR family NAD(P)-dependent oxidoreductase [Ruminococcus sp.]
MKALITGATSGIGLAVAENLSKRGWELILTGRNQKALEDISQRLGNNTQFICADLSRKEDVLKVYDFCRDKSVDMLVNNAGFGVFGKLHETDLDSELDMLSVNIVAVHILMKLFLRDFRKRNKGIILNVASSAGFMTGPLMSSYYASKNYVVRLSLAVAEELRRDNSKVSVTVFCPGPVDTNFNNRAGVSFSVKPITAEYAAQYAVEKALAGKLIAVPSLSMKAGLFGARFVPHKVLAAITYNIQKNKAGNK